MKCLLMVLYLFVFPRMYQVLYGIKVYSDRHRDETITRCLRLSQRQVVDFRYLTRVKPPSLSS